MQTREAYIRIEAYEHAVSEAERALKQANDWREFTCVVERQRDRAERALWTWRVAFFGMLAAFFVLLSITGGAR